MSADWDGEEGSAGNVREEVELARGPGEEVEPACWSGNDRRGSAGLGEEVSFPRVSNGSG